AGTAVAERPGGGPAAQNVEVATCVGAFDRGALGGGGGLGDIGFGSHWFSPQGGWWGAVTRHNLAIIQGLCNLVLKFSGVFFMPGKCGGPREVVLNRGTTDGTLAI